MAVSILALALVLNAAAAPVRSGALDRSFGHDGRVLAEPNDTFLDSSFEAMVRQPDGKLVLELSRERRAARAPRRSSAAAKPGTSSFSSGGRPASVPAIVIQRQEVRPMNAVSAMGAPLQFRIARLT